MVWNLVTTKLGDRPFAPVADAGTAAASFAGRLRAGGFGPDDVPPGLTMRGMVGSGTAANTLYHCETMLIIGGKISRHQQFLHSLPGSAISPWAAP